MRRARGALPALLAGLRGERICGADWSSVIAFANRTLLTPALFEALERSGGLGEVPGDVAEYLGFIYAENRARNLRLLAQMEETIGALNRRGIVPVLLKGSVPLFLAKPDRMPSRITSDIDVAVEAHEEAEARAVLAALGYALADGARGFGRAQDAGLVELRVAYPDPFGALHRCRRANLSVRIPPPESRALHWIVHDLIKEGDYWRGRIDLRHLHDLAGMTERGEVRWATLRAAVRDRRTRNVLDAQLLALREFYGIVIPPEPQRNPWIRFQSWRRIAAARYPLVLSPMRLMADIAWGVRRMVENPSLNQLNPASLWRRGLRSISQDCSKI